MTNLSPMTILAAEVSQQRAASYSAASRANRELFILADNEQDREWFHALWWSNQNAAARESREARYYMGVE